MGFESAPRRMIPYSVSTPQTFLMAMTRGPYPFTGERPLEILAGTDTLDGPSPGGFLALGHEGADVHDPLALLARDLGPVVGVGGVGQVLVLLVLLLDRLEQVGGTDAPALAGDDPLDGQLLGPAHDVLDHGARGEVLVVEDLLVTVLVGDLQEAVVVVVLVHLGDGALDDGLGRLLPVTTAEAGHLALVEGQVGGEVAAEDLRRRGHVGPLDLDLHVEAAGAQDGRVDQVLTVGGTDHDDVAQRL